MSNRKNPAVKRILADVRELQTHPSSRYFAAPLEDNMFEWHFTIRGPADSAFADGVYHGRILLPTDYPFKPPNIVFLTKNGRFEVGTKICLSISAYHEESWQPAWGVRTMLEAIISFMPSEGMGAIGALDWTVEERKKLAVESKSYCCSLCGKAADLLSDPALDAPAVENEKDKQALADQIAQMSMKVAAAPSSPHVGQHHSLSSDIPAAGMALRASTFAGGDLEMEIGPLSVQEGTSTYDMITTTVTAPPLEDSDGVADFLPDLTDRMSEFDNNNIDAEDNFDALGMMERLPDTVKAGGKGKDNGKEKEKVEKREENKEEKREENKGDDLCESDTLGGVNRDNSPPITTPPHSGAATPQSVLRNRKTHTEVNVNRDTSASVSVSATDSNALNASTNVGSSQHTHSYDGKCCGGQTGSTHSVSTTLRMSHSTSTSSSTSNHSSSSSGSSSSSSSSYTSTTTSLYTAVSSTTDTDSPLSEQEALLRVRLASQENDSNETADVGEERIHLAQQRLAQNLQQVPVVDGNPQLGGVRAIPADHPLDNNNIAMVPNIAENRDIVDEWLSVVLIALGTTIALMAWRIVLRYYTLFLL